MLANFLDYSLKVAINISYLYTDLTNVTHALKFHGFLKKPGTTPDFSPSHITSIWLSILLSHKSLNPYHYIDQSYRNHVYALSKAFDALHLICVKLELIFSSCGSFVPAFFQLFCSLSTLCFPQATSVQMTCSK